MRYNYIPVTTLDDIKTHCPEELKLATEAVGEKRAVKYFLMAGTRTKIHQIRLCLQMGYSDSIMNKLVTINVLDIKKYRSTPKTCMLIVANILNLRSMGLILWTMLIVVLICSLFQQIDISVIIGT